MASEEVYDEVAIERAIKEKFGIDADIRQAILLKSPVGPMSEATLFLNSKKQLYLFVSSKSKLLLSDVKKIVSSMGLKPESYLPPKGQPTYFDDIGRAKFREVFPGRGHISDQDIMYYRTLASYNPALVIISEVKEGVVYRYDTDARTSWRPAVKFAYRRIRTS